MSLTIGMIQADIKMAEYALNDYRENKKNKDIKNMCAYHIQQAAEKIIKYQIYHQLKNPNNKDMYTHNIGKLLQYATKEKIILDVPDYIVANQAIITEWEAGSRYDLHFSIRIDTLDKALQVVREWYLSINNHKEKSHE